MKVNSGQNAFFQNTNLNVILKQLPLYYNLRCFCVICIYFCFVRGSERRMKDRMRDSEFIMNCTYLSLFFPTVLYICFYFFSCLTLVSCFVCQSPATPFTFTHFSFSLSTPFSINIRLFFSHFFYSDVWWHVSVHFLSPTFFVCVFLAVSNCCIYPPLPVCPNHLLLYSHPFICISTFPVSLPFNPSFASTFASLYYS